MANALLAALNVLLGFGIPLGALLWAVLRRKSLVRPFIGGVLVFLVCQVLVQGLVSEGLLRIQALRNFAFQHGVVANVLLVLFATCVNVGGTCLAMRLLLKGDITRAGSVVFGIGCGGFEAAYLLGSNCLHLLLFNHTMLAAIPAEQFLMGGLERLSAMAIQTAATVLMARGVRQRKPLWHLAAGMLLMGSNLLALLLVAVLNIPLWWFEGIFALLGAAVLAAALCIGKPIATGKEKAYEENT